jgi:hypothetical protein
MRRRRKSRWNIARSRFCYRVDKRTFVSTNIYFLYYYNILLLYRRRCRRMMMINVLTSFRIRSQTPPMQSMYNNLPSDKLYIGDDRRRRRRQQ